jgi:hypothetical protein
MNDGKEYKGLPDPRESKFGGCEREFRNTVKPVRVKISYIHKTLEVGRDELGGLRSFYGVGVC